MVVGVSDQHRRGLRVPADRFVELNRLPADCERRQAPFVVPTHPFVAAVPPAVSRLNTESDRRPGEVDANRRPVRKLQPMLTDGFGESGCAERLDEIELETTLGRAMLGECGLQPALEAQRSVLALASMV